MEDDRPRARVQRGRQTQGDGQLAGDMPSPDVPHDGKGRDLRQLEDDLLDLEAWPAGFRRTARDGTDKHPAKMVELSRVPQLGEHPTDPIRRLPQVLPEQDRSTIVGVVRGPE